MHILKVIFTFCFISVLLQGRDAHDFAPVPIDCHIIQNPHRSHSKPVRCCRIQICNDAFVSFSLVYFAELFNTHEFNATSIFKCVLQIICFLIQNRMAPLELNPIRLAYYFGKHSLAYIELIWLVQFLLFFLWCCGHQYYLFCFLTWWCFSYVFFFFIVWGLLWNLVWFDTFWFWVAKLSTARCGTIPVVDGSCALISSRWPLWLVESIMCLWVFQYIFRSRPRSFLHRWIILIQILAGMTCQATFPSDDLTRFYYGSGLGVSLFSAIRIQGILHWLIIEVHGERPSLVRLPQRLIAFLQWFGILLFLIRWCLVAILYHVSVVHTFEFLICWTIWGFDELFIFIEIVLRADFG